MATEIEAESHPAPTPSLATGEPACSLPDAGALPDAPCPVAKARAPGATSIVLVTPHTLSGGGLPALSDPARPLAGEFVVAQAVEAPAGRKPRSAQKPTAAAAPPPLPAPTAPQAPAPFITGASGGSSSTFSVMILAALLAVFVVVYPPNARLIRLVGTLLRPPALAFGLQRPG
jgi:hypothetical protein